MKKVLILTVGAAILLGAITWAVAGTTPEEAKALVEKAVAYYQVQGKEKALKEFNNPKGEFVKGELYIFAWDMSGVSIAHINPKQIGVNLTEVPDVDGKFFRKEGLELAKKNGTAWIDYKLRNPVTNKVEKKTSYLYKVGDVVLGCGAYKP